MELQDLLRTKGFSHFEERTSHAFRIDQNSDSGASVALQNVLQWIIADKERKVSLRIDDESLTILFGNYTNFEEAKPLYEEVLGAIEKTIAGMIYKELQLRYINCILMKDSVPNDWVTPAVLGMPNFQGLHRMASISETNYETSAGSRLTVRCSSMASGLTLPPDLLPFEMETALPLQSPKPFVLLENLHAKKSNEAAFSAQSCLKEFGEMRADIHTTFRKTVTLQALEKWK